MKTYPRVLTIAGSDSGGGAGIQADIKSISATGSYAASAITAVTVQNTIGVEAVHPVPIETIVAQIRAVLSDIGADAIMVATSGHRLIEESAIKVLTEALLPMARVITPNIPEAEILTGRTIRSQADLPSVARELSAKASKPGDPRSLPGMTKGVPTEGVMAGLTGHPRPVSVLMKAGHLTDERVVDIFYSTPNTHGTGCTLSSAFASFLAQGLPLDDAARAATDYIHGAIVSGAGYEIGHGHGPVDHFYAKR